jgi:hypothetical protein
MAMAKPQIAMALQKASIMRNSRSPRPETMP